eukprot:snap_masked-scaffold_51-processed-gene-1.52-mRNA-1 protein AED:0.04 eAED:0.04 QI:0/-1/0/1/-1/1/1/0/298
MRKRKTNKHKDNNIQEPKKASSNERSFQIFSSNPEKAWNEKFFLFYSLIWPILYGGLVVTRFHLKLGDVGNLVAAVSFGCPNILIPYICLPSNLKPAKFFHSYCFKFNLWIFIFTFVASYFFTEYFFDILGMVYNFPHLTWVLDSALVGSGEQVVPIIMYIHAWYFFVTYHTASVVLIRIFTSTFVSSSNNFQGIFFWFFACALTAILFSVGEIYFTTVESIKNLFYYKDLDFALKYGSWGYACYFISSFPMVFWLDEDPAHKWSILKTIESSLAASMQSFILLDLVTKYVLLPLKQP